MWNLVRPFVYSAIRHGAVSLAAVLVAKTGIHVDEATVNGLSGMALNGLDLGVAALGGLSGSLFSNFGAVKALVVRK